MVLMDEVLVDDLPVGEALPDQAGADDEVAEGIGEVAGAPVGERPAAEEAAAEDGALEEAT